MRIKTTRKEKVQTWQARIGDFKSSGMTTTDFCKKSKLSISVFHYWAKKLSNQNSTTNDSFVEVSKPEHFSAIKPTSEYEIVFPSGSRLTFNREVDIEHLSKVVRVLREALC